MGNYCSLIHENWSKVSNPMKREIMKYMEEHYEFLVDKETYERYVLMSIGRKWKYRKHDLRKVLFKRLKDESLEQILAKAPNGGDSSQWIHLVNFFLSDEGMKASNKTYRSHQTYVQKGGNKSFAQIRFDMEEKHGGPVSDITFFRVVYMKEDKELDDGAREILERCDAALAQKKAAIEALGDNDQNVDEIELQNMVFREVCAPEHPGRVNLGGMGVIPSTFFGQKRPSTSDVRRLEAELAAERAEQDALLPAERDALLAAEQAERDNLLATERAERDTRLAVERAERAKLEARFNKLVEMLQAK